MLIVISFAAFLLLLMPATVAAIVSTAAAFAGGVCIYIYISVSGRMEFLFKKANGILA